jgi:hypothetical protein
MYYNGSCLKGLRKTTENVRISDIQAGIRTMFAPNMNHEGPSLTAKFDITAFCDEN